MFHPEGYCLYGTGKGVVDVFGWEPIQLYDTVNLPDSNLPADVAVAHDQLVSYSELIGKRLVLGFKS